MFFNGFQARQKIGVAFDGGDLMRGQKLERADGVLIGGGKKWGIDAGKEGYSLVVPRPPEIVGEFSESLDEIGARVFHGFDFPVRLRVGAWHDRVRAGDG